MPTTHDRLHDNYVLDDSAWSPRTAVYTQATRYAELHGLPIPSDREVYSSLRLRGFRESTRKGVRGFHGIRTAPALATVKRPTRIPGTSSGYRSGDRSTASLDAVRIDRSIKKAHTKDPGLSAQQYDPWAVHAEPAMIQTSPLPPLEPIPALPTSPTLPDGAARHTRVTRVLVTRTESRWGPAPGWSCVYCGAPGTTVDHFQPWSESHDSSPANLVPCCTGCQGSKLDKDPATWMASAGVPTDAAAFLTRIATDPGWTHPAAE